jgi:hypothetical protein
VSACDGSAGEAVAEKLAAGGGFYAAVDGVNMYYTTYSSTGGPINRIPKQGGTPTPLADGQVEAMAIATDGRYVYWLNQSDPGSSTGQLNKVPVGGGPVETMAEGVPYNYDLKVDGTDLYLATSSGLKKIPTAGGTLAQIQDGYFNGVAFDAGYIYGLETIALFKIPKAGGAAVSLCDPNAYAGAYPNGGLAAGPTHIFWTVSSSGDGAVLKVPLSGGTPSVVLSSIAEPRALAIEGSYLFYACESATSPGIYQMTAAGGAPVQLSTTGQLTFAYNLAPGGDGYLYWNTFAAWRAPIKVLP